MEPGVSFSNPPLVSPRSGAHLPTVYRVSRKFHWSLLNLRGSSSTPSQHIGKVDSEMVENAAKHTPLPKVFTYRISAAMKGTSSCDLSDTNESFVSIGSSSLLILFSHRPLSLDSAAGIMG